mmetsp:Transcript_99847/g.316986  ORF Transcript_99847/g.316986 Transcript_99847/m.316986 type:complete len:316 (+) Transcript_99847:71-1018(+)
MGWHSRSYPGRLCCWVPLGGLCLLAVGQCAGWPRSPPGPPHTACFLLLPGGGAAGPRAGLLRAAHAWGGSRARRDSSQLQHPIWACAAMPEWEALMGGSAAAGAAPVAASLASGLAWSAVSGAAVLYIVISFTEYAYHRYVQHLDLNRLGVYQFGRQVLGAPTLVGDFHMLHHRETLDDMSIEPLSKDAFPDATVHRGTSATWLSFFKMAFIVMLQACIPLTALGWSLPAAAVAVLSSTLLHLRAYNSLHPQLHGLPNVTLAEGPPSFPPGSFYESGYARWLRQYHVVHHRSRASRNFNVCCPLVDHLLGTHAEV